MDDVALIHQAYRFALEPTAEQERFWLAVPGRRDSGSTRGSLWSKRLPDNRHVSLDRRLGPVRTKESLRKLSRLLASDAHARVLRSTVQRANGGWVISFTVERSAKRRRARRPNAAVGVDLGVTRLATLSTGHSAANARRLEARHREIQHLERRLDRQRRANNPENYMPDGRVRPGRALGRSPAGCARQSGDSPECTSASRTGDAARRIG